MEIRHDPGASRYELIVDDQPTGVADYEDRGDVLVFFHTEVDADRRGQGLGTALVGGALDDVRRSGRSIVARCPFVARFVDEHAEFRDLVSG